MDSIPPSVLLSFSTPVDPVRCGLSLSLVGAFAFLIPFL